MPTPPAAPPLAAPLDAILDAVRAPCGPLSPAQRAAARPLLAAVRAAPELTDNHQRAYVLATAWHETGGTLLPVREIGQGRGRAYGRPGRHGGQIAYGRGYVQLTWDSNYAEVDRRLGLQGRLLADYDLALTPAIATDLLIRGMAGGWFTGQRLSDYLHGRGCDYLGARRVVNGQDRASLVARYARAWEGALTGEPR